MNKVELISTFFVPPIVTQRLLEPMRYRPFVVHRATDGAAAVPLTARSLLLARSSVEFLETRVSLAPVGRVNTPPDTVIAAILGVIKAGEPVRTNPPVPVDVAPHRVFTMSHTVASSRTVLAALVKSVVEKVSTPVAYISLSAAVVTPARAVRVASSGCFVASWSKSNFALGYCVSVEAPEIDVTLLATSSGT